MHHRIKMSYLEPILVHPVRRQIFGDTSGQTFYMTRDPVVHWYLMVPDGTFRYLSAPNSSYELIFFWKFSGGGPQGWSIFSSIWNLTLALDSFSQIARWFVKSVWPIRLVNVSLEKWHLGWFRVLKFDSHLCWWVAHSNLVVSAWPVPMYLDCRCSIWERMLNRPALSVPDILTNDETINRLFYCSS